MFRGDRNIPTRGPTVSVGNEAYQVSHLTMDPRVGIFFWNQWTVAVDYSFSDVLYNICWWHHWVDVYSQWHALYKVGLKQRLNEQMHQNGFRTTYVGPQNAPLHNMLLLVAYCVPCIHNMLRWSILCTLHTQYATRGAYCVGSVHMLFQWSSEGTQYALLENMSRGMFAFF